MNLNSKSIILIISYFFLILISFFINHWVGSRGLFPIDSFVHFDPAVRILNNELPIRDFWIVHGLIVDLIQAFFFKIFGISWQTYLLHGSLFNSIIAIFSFKILKDFNVDIKYAFILTLFIAFLGYPVSATPFLDLHSTYLSLFSMYLLMIFVKNDDYSKLFMSIILLGFAFFCKQVPATYFIIFTSLFIIYYSYLSKSFKPIIVSALASILFIILVLIYLFSTKTEFKELLLQLFIFPSSIGFERYTDYSLNINNLFLNFKFIYLALFLTILAFLSNYYYKNFIDIKKKLNIFIILIFFTISLIFHQIHTKNQIFIFFLIPLLSGFFIYFLNDNKIKYKKSLINFIILFCFFITVKYHDRFNEMRKFHELSSTNIDNAIDVDFEKPFFNGLKWITPSFKDPEEELKILKDFYLEIKKRDDNNMIISRYTFLGGLLNKSTFTPSRTFDDISYPFLNNENFTNYKNFFKKNIKKKNISNIYIFNPGFEPSEEALNNVIYDYLPEECYKSRNLDYYTIKIEIQNCNYLAR